MWKSKQNSPLTKNITYCLPPPKKLHKTETKADFLLHLVVLNKDEQFQTEVTFRNLIIIIVIHNPELQSVLKQILSFFSFAPDPWPFWTGMFDFKQNSSSKWLKKQNPRVYSALQKVWMMILSFSVEPGMLYQFKSTLATVIWHQSCTQASKLFFRSLKAMSVVIPKTMSWLSDVIGWNKYNHIYFFKRNGLCPMYPA